MINITEKINKISNYENSIVSKNEENPYIMYLIVNKELNMGIGKIAAQCAHASQMITLEYFKLLCKENLLEIDFLNINNFEMWCINSFRKIVKGANKKEWEKLKELNHISVIDSGLTEIAPNSNTVLGFFPMQKNDIPKLIYKLQLLK